MNGFSRAEADWLTPPEAKVVCECGHCGGEIYQGQDAIEYDGELFCDTDCAMNYMKANGEFTEEVLIEVEKCEYCEHDIEVGADVIVYDGSVFCDEECVLEHLKHNGSFEEVIAE